MRKTFYLGGELAPESMQLLQSWFKEAPMVPPMYPLLSFGPVTLTMDTADVAAFQQELPTFHVEALCTGGLQAFDTHVPSPYGEGTGSVHYLQFDINAELYAIREAFVAPLAPALRIRWTPHLIICEPVDSGTARNFLRGVQSGLAGKMFKFSGLRLSDTRVDLENIDDVSSDLARM